MGPSSSPYTTLILIALMAVAFYFLIIRPNKKRVQAQQRTMSSLTPGTRVMLTSGIFGTLQDIGDKQAVLEVAPGVELTVLKQAIARAALPSDENTVSDDDYDSDDDVVDDQPTTQAAPTTGLTASGPSDSGSHALADPSGAPDAEHIPFSGTSTTPIKD